MTLPHHVDSCRHARGEHALMDEIRRLHALLTVGAELVETLRCLVHDDCAETSDWAQAWCERVREEIGGKEE